MHRHRSGLVLLVALACAAAVPGCKNKDELGRLRPPDGAEGFTSNFTVAFDDQYTAMPIEMEGRAPNDVRDQNLFHARLGHADLVLLVEVDQVWGRGLYEGKTHGDWTQYLDVHLGDVIMGELDKDVDRRQLVQVQGEDLPASLEGQQLIMFLKWAPGEEPPYHHHLMPKDEQAISMARAMVEHAEAEGVIGDRGDKKRARRARRDRRRDADGATGG